MCVVIDRTRATTWMKRFYINTFTHPGELEVVGVDARLLLVQRVQAQELVHLLVVGVELPLHELAHQLPLALQA